MCLYESRPASAGVTLREQSAPFPHVNLYWAACLTSRLGVCRGLLKVGATAVLESFGVKKKLGLSKKSPF